MESSMYKIRISIVEYVEFKPLNGVKDEQMFSALKETDSLLQDIKGFKSRLIAKSDQIFVEVVYWDSQEEASKGLKIFQEDIRYKNLFNLIDKDTVTIRYSSIVDL